MSKYYAILLLLCFQSFGQNILNDSISAKGKILKQLKKDGKIKISLEGFGCSKLIPGYRICKADSNIEALNKTLTNREIDLLSTSENPTIKFVAFILFAKRNNNKRVLVEKLKHIFDTERFILMSDACEPIVATSISSFQTLCFNRVRRHNKIL